MTVARLHSAPFGSDICRTSRYSRSFRFITEIYGHWEMVASRPTSNIWFFYDTPLFKSVQRERKSLGEVGEFPPYYRYSAERL